MFDLELIEAVSKWHWKKSISHSYLFFQQVDVDKHEHFLMFSYCPIIYQLKYKNSVKSIRFFKKKIRFFKKKIRF